MVAWTRSAMAGRGSRFLPGRGHVGYRRRTRGRSLPLTSPVLLQTIAVIGTARLIASAADLLGTVERPSRMRCLTVSLLCSIVFVASWSCAGDAKEVAALRLELQSLTGVLDTDIEAAKQSLNASVTLAANRNDVDELLGALRSGWGDMKAACETTRSKLDALEAFLIRHDEFSEELGFASVRARLADRRRETEQQSTSLAASLASIRDVRTDVVSRAEWQKLDVSVTQGDRLLVVPTGKWSIGSFAGSCAGTGMHDGNIQPYALEAKAPVGALLVRAGEHYLGCGELGTKVEGPGGNLEARCNDRDYMNNSGKLSVRVVAFRAP